MVTTHECNSHVKSQRQHFTSFLFILQLLHSSLFIYLYFMSMRILFAYAHTLYMCVLRLRSQKRLTNSRRLALEMGCELPLWMLGSESGLSKCSEALICLSSPRSLTFFMPHLSWHTLSLTWEVDTDKRDKHSRHVFSSRRPAMSFCINCFPMQKGASLTEVENTLDKYLEVYKDKDSKGSLTTRTFIKIN